LHETSICYLSFFTFLFNLLFFLSFFLKHQADELAQKLRMRNFEAESYHAGKTKDERTRIQNRFMRDESEENDQQKKILVATIAFGMGVNKRNIRAVIHYNLPKSLENYVQVSFISYLFIYLFVKLEKKKRKEKIINHKKKKKNRK